MLTFSRESSRGCMRVNVRMSTDRRTSHGTPTSSFFCCFLPLVGRMKTFALMVVFFFSLFCCAQVSVVLRSSLTPDRMPVHTAGRERSCHRESWTIGWRANVLVRSLAFDVRLVLFHHPSSFRLASPLISHIRRDMPYCQ